MEEVDRVANRVSIAAVSGLIAGAAFATHRGASVPRTAVSVAASCALIGTACFGTERIANMTMKQVAPTNDPKTNARMLYVSHAIGGFAGGGITGGLFQRHPVPGMILFAPVMMAFAWAELRLEQEREERLREFVQVDQDSPDDIERQKVVSEPKMTSDPP